MRNAFVTKDAAARSDAVLRLESKTKIRNGLWAKTVTLNENSTSIVRKEDFIDFVKFLHIEICKLALVEIVQICVAKLRCYTKERTSFC